MVNIDENPYQSPQSVDHPAEGTSDGPTLRELAILAGIVVAAPLGLFAAIVFVAQLVTSILAD